MARVPLSPSTERAGIVIRMLGSARGRPMDAGTDRPTRMVLVSAVLLPLAMLMQPGEATADAALTIDGRARSFSGGTPAVVAIERRPAPVTIRIEAAGIDAAVETSEIVDGALTDPSGPWVVAWYRETARPGESGNVVMGGHVDYWGTGPAVFYGLGTLARGAEIDVTDADGAVYTYVVEWVKTYTAADLTVEQLREIVGPTEHPGLTLITCGGEFDYERGEYLSRLVVRARRR